ncbi:MAG: sulfotransferase domain-containing protein [Phycisphaerales bacterium]|nr:sulfotransferase domain-containing protein [Phycisphaerales bacterium]
MKLPTFLIIGAQKAGTTTLYRDLLSQPGVFFPYHKEPTNLAHDHVLTERGLAEYAALYKGANESDARGDASTGYARIPLFDDVPQRARKVLGEDIRLLYILREPVSRIVSHHHHIASNHPCAELVDDFIHEEDQHALTFSRYAFQLEAWLEEFPLENIRVLIFEEFVKDRRGTIEGLGDFLGFEPQVQKIDTEAKFNAATNRSRDKGLMMKLRRSSAYGRIRPMLSADVRDRLRRALTPKAPPPPPPPTEKTVDEILKHLEEDQRRLAELIGRTYPIWDPDKTRQKFEERRRAHASKTASS